MTDCIFLGSKITANGDCSHEIKRCLFLGRKAMTNLDSILKSKDIPLPTNDKCSSSQSYKRVGRFGRMALKHVNIMYEMSCQSRFDARYWMLGAGALGRPRGMEWGGRREEGSGWGTHVYLWRINFDKNKNKIK